MVELRAGEMRLVLDPATGGAIAALEHAGVPLLRPVIDPRLRAQIGRPVAAYSLLPFANRIAFGRFSLDGRTYRLVPNFGDEPHAIHGNAWMHPWTAETPATDAALLALDYTPTPGEWPFAYRAEQAFRLEPHALRLDVSLTNTDAVAWPAGLGLHPYVARHSATTLAFRARTVWTSDVDGMPDRQIPVPPALDFSQGRSVGAQAVDSCFAGWRREATIGWPQHATSLRIAADTPLDHLQVYTPADKDFIGIEPVSNMPDAINRIDHVPGQGLRLLGPKEVLRATIVFTVLT